MGDHTQNLQDVFLEHLRTHKTPTTVFLANGVKLQGIIIGFDAISMLLRRESHAQLIYKHAISTVMPNEPIHISQTDPVGFEPT
jgi:host factor-I protein